MEKNKKIILIIVISLLVLSVLGLSGYIIYDKVINNSVASKNTTTVETKYVFKKHSTDTLNKCFSNLNDEKGGDCTEVIKTSSGGHILKLHVLPDSSSDGPVPVLYIDDKKVTEFDISGFDGIDEIYIIDDSIVLSTDVGSDIRGDFTYIYILKNKKLSTIYSLDSKYPAMVMKEFPDFVNGKIIFYGAVLGQGPSILNNLYDEEVYICDKEDMSKHNYDGDTVVEGIYEIEYLGNNKFSEITRLKEFTLNDTNLLDTCE